MPPQNSLPRDFDYFAPIRDTGYQRGLRGMMTGLPNLHPLLDAVRAHPSRVLNPVDLAFEIVRAKYFKGAVFDGPAGDPGYFGPDSAMWRVLSDVPAFGIGLLNGLFIELFHPSIQYAGFDHTIMLRREENGRPTGPFHIDWILRRGGESIAGFYGVGMGSTPTADAMGRIITAMHAKTQGVRPDGETYDATDPDFYRWTYATVVYPIAKAHTLYHRSPLRGSEIDEFYRDFARLGQAMGNGVDLPTNRRDCEDVLRSRAHEVVLNIDNSFVPMTLGPKGKRLTRPVFSYLFWLHMHLQPDWFKQLLTYRARPIHRLYYLQTKTAFRLANRIGVIGEVTQSYERAGQPRPATGPTRLSASA